MKKIILIGRSGAGKTTLTQALKGEEIKYHKTQYVNHFESIIDTPGEYAQTHELGYALALYSYEADVVGLLLSAEEPFSLYPPNITCMVNREVVGIITPCRFSQRRSGAGGTVAAAVGMPEDLPRQYDGGGRGVRYPGLSQPGRGRKSRFGGRL